LAAWTHQSVGASSLPSIALQQGMGAASSDCEERTPYRLRVGDWRVIFRRLDDELVILVVRVLPRARAYDR
jgi:mRNA-degrading endonuclease RelE of RelBE toxin-antitoxin system